MGFGEVVSSNIFTIFGDWLISSVTCFLGDLEFFKNCGTTSFSVSILMIFIGMAGELLDDILSSSTSSSKLSTLLISSSFSSFFMAL